MKTILALALAGTFPAAFSSARAGDGDAQSRFIFTRCNDLSEQMLFERSEP